MKKSIYSVFLAIVMLMGLLSGCTPASTPLPSAPTNTPLPTKTPVPTKTPIPPTATIQAPDKTLEYLNGVQVVNIDDFDLATEKWGNGLISGGISDGVLNVIGKDWNGIVRDRDFKDNQGVIIDFTFSKDSVFEILMDSGEWSTDPYKRFGVYIENSAPRINVWVKQNFLGGPYMSGNLKLNPDTSYTALMVLLPDGGFLCTIWDPSDPSKALYYREGVGKNWSNLTWKFRIGADKGTIVFDNYREITFDSVK